VDCLLWTFHINGLTQRVVFSVWVLFLYVFSSFIPSGSINQYFILFIFIFLVVLRFEHGLRPCEAGALPLNHISPPPRPPPKFSYLFLPHS
jgi:hypothetical protein